MQDKELLNELIVESREHLENIEPDLLELEQKAGNVSDDLINRVFRAVHSIKGGFGFFGIKNIVDLAHVMENVMSNIRDKNLTVNPEVIDALLAGIDKLRTLLDDVNNSDSIPIEEEVKNLNPFLIGGTSTEKKNSPSPEVKDMNKDSESYQTQKLVNQYHPDLNKEHYITAVKNGTFIYQVTLDHKRDLLDKKISFSDLFKSWEKFGDILESNPPREKLETRKSKTPIKKDISVICMSVLEPDLISEAIAVAEEQILTVDLSYYHDKLIAEQEELEKKEQTATVAKGVTAETKHEARIEEALRVKVSLLNNLMNFAGELVLARNQLIQSMSNKISDNPVVEKVIKVFMDMVKQSFSKFENLSQGSKQQLQNTIDAELSQLTKKLRDAFNLQMSDMQGISGIVQNINMVTTMLQESIMQTRMQPISVVFSKFPRVIRDLAKKLGKEISLTQIGQEVELDKSIIELLSDPLTHLVRNCADHGIETPDTRLAANKSAKGEVILRAFQEGGKVIIDIIDDGAGINTEAVKAKALEKGVITQEIADKLSLKEIQMLIFAPGFSTAKVVSDVSGRGVGMDVVKTNIERLGGTIEVDSEEGKGTTISLKLPLTLAIIPSLIIKASDRRFAVPQVGLEEVVRIRAKDITKMVERVHNAEVLRLRGKLLPLVRLSTVLGLEPAFIHPKTGTKEKDRRERWSDRRGKQIEETDLENQTDTNQNKRTGKKDRRENIKNAVKVVVLKSDNKHYGLIVDDVLDSEEIVVKPLPDYLKTVACYAGVTIMGDGKVAMILDTNGVADMAELRFDELESEISAEKSKAEREKKVQKENMLIFSIGGPELFAIDLGRVSRIEKRKIDEIELIGNKEFLKYDNSSLRLFRLENYLPIQPPSDSSENMFIIVPKNAKYPLGIVTSLVEDTVETELNIDKDSVKGVGVQGSAIINKKMTVILDVPTFLETVETEFEQ